MKIPTFASRQESYIHRGHQPTVIGGSAPPYPACIACPGRYPHLSLSAGHPPSLPLLPRVWVHGGVRIRPHCCRAPQPPHVGQGLSAIQDLSHSHSPMPPPDNTGSPSVKMAKIAASEPAIRPVAMKLPAFHLAPGLIHTQETPTNCYGGLCTSLPCLYCLPRPIPSPKPPRRAPSKSASLAEGSGAWRRKDLPPLLQSLPATSCGSMPSPLGHP